MNARIRVMVSTVILAGVALCVCVPAVAPNDTGEGGLEATFPDTMNLGRGEIGLGETGRFTAFQNYIKVAASFAT